MIFITDILYNITIPYTQMKSFQAITVEEILYFRSMENKMKKVLMIAAISIAVLGFTGCADKGDGMNAGKCGAGKCGNEKKCGGEKKCS